MSSKDIILPIPEVPLMDEPEDQQKPKSCVWLQHRKDDHQTSEVNPSKSIHHGQENLKEDRDGEYESYGGARLLCSKCVDFGYRRKPQKMFMASKDIKFSWTL